MVDDQVSNLRALLRSGELIDIGGPRFGESTGTTSHSESPIAKRSRVGHVAASDRASGSIPASTSRLMAAFAAIYLIWGSTYLAIRYAIETIPPLLMMGMRHLAAGGLLYFWVRWRGTPSPKRREWFYPAIIGGFLFLGGHGSLAWAEQHVPSGIAAVLVATLPMWIVVLARISGTERKLSGRSVAGLVLGFIGVAVLFAPDLLRHGGELDPLGAGAVLFGTFVWAAATIYMRNVKMPDSPLLSSAMQMLAGGVALLSAAALTGEVRTFHFAAVSWRSWLALAYLAGFGSILAFTAYTWLHTVAPPSRVATYAYVNPVVAVLVGWLVAAEPVGVVTVLAMLGILAGVALVNAGHKEEARAPQHHTECEEEVAA
jgi:drug/metabolite transporter (DMT)-like permease